MRWQEAIRTPGLGRRVAPLILAAAAVAALAGAADEPEVLPRSIYVPVRIEVASCLRDVVIRNEEGTVRAVAPGRLVSQFTFLRLQTRLQTGMGTPYG